MPSSVTVASPIRVAEEMPAAAARTMPVTASGRRTAARRATRPPSEWPTQGAGSASSASSDREDGVGERVEACRAAREAARSRRARAAPGRSPAAPRRARARRAASSRRGRRARGRARAAALAADEVAEPRPAAVSVPLLESEQIPFGLRRHQGIFFTVMNALEGRAE